MATNQIRISLSELRSTCIATVNSLSHYIKCGKTLDDAYHACANQLMGISCLVMGSVGEPAVKDAMTALKLEYMRIKNEQPSKEQHQAPQSAEDGAA